MVLVGVVPSASAQPRQSDPAAGDARPVIVVLADQHEEAPATAAGAGRRRALALADQQPLVDQVRAASATGVRQFSVMNAFAATVPVAMVSRLAADARVRAVVPDRVVTVPRRRPDAVRVPAAAMPICPGDPARPQLEPEALGLIDAVRAQGLTTGTGVKVGFVADGLDIDNPDLIRPDGTRVVVDYRDFTGEGVNAPSSGTEALGDASAIAAQGRQTYDLSTFVNPASPLPPGCTIRILGVAPGASLSVAKVTPAEADTTDSMIVQGIDYEVTVAKVDVLNESLGNNPMPDLHTDPISLANHAAVAAGITVVVASGDGGPFGTVGNPAGDPAVVSVAASTSFRARAQLSLNLPGFTGDWTSDNVASISSGGVAELGTVDDLMAPGDEGWALCSTNTALFPGCTNGRGQPSPIQDFAGTSQAAPFVAGTAALVVSAYAGTHHSARPSPALVKQILASTAIDKGDPADRQGAGLLDVFHAVQAALSIQDSEGSPAPRDANLLVDPTQLPVTGNPSIARDLPLTVTNIGATTQTVSAHNRVLHRSVFDRRGSFAFDTTAPGTPSWVDGFGTAHAFTTRRFTVAPGADHLDASIAYAPPGGDQIRLRLLDPGGGLVAVDDNEGPAGFGHVDVHAPVPGTWTAIFDSVVRSGFHGTVHFDFAGTAYTALGTVTPASLTLRPGQRGTFRVRVSTPAQPGDLSAAVQLDSSTGRRLAVPLTLRSLIPIRDGQGAYTGTLFGGVGRDGVPAQTSFYRFDVPPGLHDLAINLTLSRNPDQEVFGYLQAPDGQLLSQQTNIEGFDENGNAIFGRSLQEFRTAPPPGRWTFVVFVFNPVAGTTTSQRFAGQVRFNTVDVHAAGVPHGAALPAGHPVTATVTVHNTGIAPENFFVDPRRADRADLRLVTTQSETGIPLPQSRPVEYTLPTQCDRITTTATAPVPIDIELFSITRFPYTIGRSATTHPAVATVPAAEVTPGSWSVEASMVGPFPPGGRTTTTDLRTVGHCRTFDPTATSSTGDIWPGFVQGTPPSFRPLVLQPGQTGTITVTFTPTGPAGTAVTGALFVDDFTDDAGTGDELTAIPYAYLIG